MNKTLRLNQKLVKLPKSNNYFGYTNALGVIYFIHSDAEKFITKFHKSLNKNGHMIVPKSKRGDEIFLHEYRHGVLLGDTFWTFGKHGRSNEWIHVWQNSSILWLPAADGKALGVNIVLNLILLLSTFTKT